ncbi:LORF2 protein, partial [Crocuta crocuta]
PLWKIVLQFLTQLSILLSYISAITLLGVHLNGLKTYVYTKTCMLMFIAPLIILPKLGSNHDCFVDKWVHKLQCIQRMEYYSTLKINELSIHERTWRNHKCMLKSEGNLSKKATYYMILKI